jgi:hypothetical protein
LNWTRHELATAAYVPLWFIADFEDGKATPGFFAGYEVSLGAALESAGVIFVEENGEGPGVRLKKGSNSGKIIQLRDALA